MGVLRVGEILLVASEGCATKTGGLFMTKLGMLNAQRAEKFTALCALVARDLGYGELPQLSEVDRNHIEGEAKHYVELWEETVNPLANSRATNIPPAFAKPRHLERERG